MKLKTRERLLLRIKNKGSETESNNNDRYLITYADLITLLLGLFVILYASSQVDEEKYKEVSAALSDYFKSDPNGVLNGGTGVMNGSKGNLPQPIVSSGSPGDKSLEDIAEETKSALSSYINKGDIEVKLNGKDLVLSLPEKLLFQSASAEIEPQGNIILDTLSTILKGIKYEIEVDGHTDSDPIRTFKYESNWHLSGARAVNVAYKLIRRGVPEANMSFRGFGAQRPVGDNASDAGKSRNRRVEITISDLPATAPSADGYASGDSSERENK